MLSKYVKQHCVNFLTPLAKLFKDKDPSFVVFLSVAFSFLGASFVYKGIYIAGFVFFLLSFIFDALDRAVAKINKKKPSKLYSYYDAITDRINEFMMLFPLAFRGYAFESFFALAMSYLMSYSRARACKENREWPSIGEREDRMAVLLLLYFVASFLSYPQQVIAITYLLYFVAAISLIGIVRRVFYAIRTLGE